MLQHSSTHVKFNFKAHLTDESKQFLNKITAGILSFFPQITPTTPDDYHVTLGQSTYFVRGATDDNDNKLLQKIENNSPRVASDYDNILSSLTSGLGPNDITQMNAAAVLSFRITTNGFVVVDLQADQNATNIARLYQKAATLASNSTTAEPLLDLTEFYQMGTNFSMHVTIGKLNIADKSICETYLQKYFADKRSFNCSQKINFTNGLTVDASYKSYGKHVNIKIHKISTNLPKNKPGILYSFPKSKASSSATTATSSPLETFSPELLAALNDELPAPKKINALQVTTAIDQLHNFDRYKFTFANATAHGFNEITFQNSKDKKVFCKKFNDSFSLNEGQCFSNDYTDIVLLDDAAIHTLVQSNKPSVTAAKRSVFNG